MAVDFLPLPLLVLTAGTSQGRVSSPPWSAGLDQPPPPSLLIGAKPVCNQLPGSGTPSVVLVGHLLTAPRLALVWCSLTVVTAPWVAVAVAGAVR